ARLRLHIIKASNYLHIARGRTRRYRPAVQGPGRSQPAEAPGPAACPRRPHAERTVRTLGYDAARRDAALGGIGDSEPGHHRAARARKAALPQSGAAAGDLRALDRQVRKAPPESPLGSEKATGEIQWLDRSLST